MPGTIPPLNSPVHNMLKYVIYITHTYLLSRHGLVGSALVY